VGSAYVERRSDDHDRHGGALGAILTGLPATVVWLGLGTDVRLAVIIGVTAAALRFLALLIVGVRSAVGRQTRAQSLLPSALLVRLHIAFRFRQARGEDPHELRLDCAFAKWCFTVECGRPRRWAAASSDPTTSTAATTPTSRSVARSMG
jgi:hypothetical protein